MPKPIPLSVPTIGGNAWRYIKDCLDTGWVSSVGRYVGAFERSVSAYTGAKHAVAVVNGTAALHLAAETLGLGPKDAVLVPALTFIATANAMSYTGAECVLLDCEPRRFNLDLDRAEEGLERVARRRGGRWTTKSGRRVRAIVATHILGYPMDMDAVAAFARRNGLIVIEDAAESLGSLWRGRHTGTFGALGILSFNGNKVVTTGGGGMVLTADARLARAAKHLSTQAKAADGEYIHDAIGHNYRLTNVLAALGLSQIELLPKFLARRRAVAQAYRDALPGVPVEPDDARATWNRWLFGVQVADLKRRDLLLRRFAAAGIQARPLWRPVPLQAPYRRSPAAPIPEARRAYETVVNIPSSSSLTEAQIARVVKILRAFPLVRLLA